MPYECVLLYQIIFVHFSCNSCLVLSRTFVISKIFNPSSQIICIVCQEAEKYDFCCIVVKSLTVMEIFKFSLAAAIVELNRNEGLNCIFFLKIQSFLSWIFQNLLKHPNIWILNYLWPPLVVSLFIVAVWNIVIIIFRCYYQHQWELMKIIIVQSWGGPRGDTVSNHQQSLVNISLKNRIFLQYRGDLVRENWEILLEITLKLFIFFQILHFYK